MSKLIACVGMEFTHFIHEVIFLFLADFLVNERVYELVFILLVLDALNLMICFFLALHPYLEATFKG